MGIAAIDGGWAWALPGAAVLAALPVLIALHERRRRERAEAALRAMQDLLGAAPLALLAWSPRRGVLLWNGAAEYLFGLPRAAVLARALPECLAPLRAAADEALAGVQGAVALAVQLDDARGETLHLSASVGRLAGGDAEDAACIALIEDRTAQHRREARRIDVMRSQRDALVREVHHRIKNHLQGVAGLLRQHLAGKPLLKPLLDAATAQVLSIAAVHGLQGEGPGGALELRDLLARIAASISGVMPGPIVLDESCAALEAMRLSEDEAVPMAMVLNELLTNAIKHRGRGPRPGLVQVGAARFGAQVAIRIANEGFLPPRFDFAQGRHIGTGLGLVKSLLPTHGARLAVEEQGERVVATLLLGPPHVFATDEAARGGARA